MTLFIYLTSIVKVDETDVADYISAVYMGGKLSQITPFCERHLAGLMRARKSSELWHSGLDGWKASSLAFQTTDNFIL